MTINLAKLKELEKKATSGPHTPQRAEFEARYIRELRNAFPALVRKLEAAERMAVSLENIKKHQEIVGGSLGQYGVTFGMASEALKSWQEADE